MAGKQKLAHEVSDLQEARDAKDAYLARIAERDAQVEALNKQLADLDTTKTQELNDALETNSALRRDLRVAQRMRLTGTTCPGPASSGEAQPPGSVGDATGVELSGATRQAVWDLRASLLSDRAKLDYCQAYVRQLMP
jgi:hypothetical protein